MLLNYAELYKKGLSEEIRFNFKMHCSNGIIRSDSQFNSFISSEYADFQEFIWSSFDIAKSPGGFDYWWKIVDEVDYFINNASKMMNKVNIERVKFDFINN